MHPNRSLGSTKTRIYAVFWCSHIYVKNLDAVNVDINNPKFLPWIYIYLT